MSLFTRILSQLFLFLLQSTTTTAVSNTTTSLWLPWLPDAIDQPLYASAINAAPNATTYALSCPTITNLPSNVEPACIINGPIPQTVTAGPSTAIMSRSANGNFEQWACDLTGTTQATCKVLSTSALVTVAGQTQGPGQDSSVSTYAADGIVFRPVTITAGSLTAGAAVSTTASAGGGVAISVSAMATTSMSGVNTSMAGNTTSVPTTATANQGNTSTATAPAIMTKNAASAVHIGPQGLWFAFGVAIMGLAIGML